MVTCPKNEALWILRENSEQCRPGTFYHCVKTQLGQIFETCVDYIWVQKDYCPEWNIAGSLDVVSCAGLNGCPSETFKSNEVYKYPVCLQTLQPTTTASTTTTTYSTSTVVPNTTMSMSVSSTDSNASSEYKILWFFVLMTILSCVVLVTLIAFVIRYILRDVKITQKGKQLDTKDPEKPVNGGDVTIEPTLQTPLLDGQGEEEKNEIVVEEIEIDEVVEVNDETKFVKSDAFKEGIDVLKKDDVLIIIGSPGSGKTATASEIVSTYKKRNWACITIDTLHRSELNLNFSIKQVILIDNCFGTWNDGQPIKVLLQTLDRLRFLFSDGLQKPGRIKLILSIRKRAYNNHKMYLKTVPGLLQSQTVDLDAESSFTPLQKRFLFDYLSGQTDAENEGSDNKGKKLLDDFSKHCEQDGLGFPLKVQLLSRISGLSVTEFLNDVIGCLKRHFKSMEKSKKEEDQLNYVALMYVMLKGRFSEKCKLDQECSKRLHSSLGEQKLKTLLVALNQYLTRDEENYYVFAHEILYIAAFQEFYSEDTETLLKFCNIGAILELVRIGRDTVIATDNFEVNLKQNQYNTLVDRIVDSGLEVHFDGHQLNESKVFKDMLEAKTNLEKCVRELKNPKIEKDLKKEIKRYEIKFETKYMELKAMSEKFS